jgi:hypothetical protein
MSVAITPNGRAEISPRGDVRVLPPTDNEVRILDSDVACVGLSDEFGVDNWGMKIVKLIAFPELIFSSGRNESKNSPDSNYSIPSSCQGYADDSEGGDDGYFSPSGSSPEMGDTTHDHGSSSPATASSGPRSRVWSGGSLSSIDTNILSDNFSGSKPTSPSTPSSSIHDDEIPQKPLTVPFFSFIRTQEGSSLTADVKVLAALFPPEQRHLLVCGGSLEPDTNLDEGYGCSGSDEGDSMGDDDGSGMCIGELKCLQVDLRRFGLGKLLHFHYYWYNEQLFILF